MAPSRTDPAPPVPPASPVALPARERAWARALRQDPCTLAEMARAAAGPFHVLHPATFADNVRAFERALVDAGVNGRIFYGKKANKSACFVETCAAGGTGIDVASAPELTAALRAGLDGLDLVVTGPAKSSSLLDLATRQDALIAVDALDELEHLLAVARRLRRRARIVLRVLPAHDPTSRFGLDDAELDLALERCVSATEVEMTGFSFHLSGYSVAPRAEAAADLVRRCVEARRRGLPAMAVSIGGGFAVSYVAEPDWAAFLAGHDDSWYHAGHRPPRFYPYHQAPAGADMLAAVLAHPVGAEGTLADALTAAGVRLLLEPGRALLDGAGATVVGVQGTKRRRDDAGDYAVVTVDGLSMSLSEQWKGSEFLPDPVLWPGEPVGEPVRACVGGASCLEYDMLTWRKVPLPRAPRVGDLLVYPNTAGYQMDKNETRFHDLPLPPRFLVEGGVDGEDSSWRSPD